MNKSTSIEETRRGAYPGDETPPIVLDTLIRAAMVSESLAAAALEVNEPLTQ